MESTGRLARQDRQDQHPPRPFGMKRSVERLDTEPDMVLVDGNTLIPDLGIYQKCDMRNDIVPSIAAASVIASSQGQSHADA